VVDERARFVGVLRRAQLERVAEAERSRTTIRRLLPCSIQPLTPGQPVDDALEQLADYGVPWLPVVADGRVLGGLGVRDAVHTYKSTLQRSARRTRGLPGDTSVFEVQLRADSPVVGRTLGQAGLPQKVLIAAIRRQGETIFPTATTRLEAGDTLTALAEPAREAVLREFFDSSLDGH
jgi:CBS domain-containing protein